MIDYFIHFVNKSLHFLTGKDPSSINHRSDFADKLTDFFYTHPCLLSNPMERALIIRHFFHIDLNLSPQHFCKIGKLLMNQIRMVMLLVIKRTYQLGEFKRFVFRFMHYGYGPLPPSRRKHHKE